MKLTGIGASEGVAVGPSFVPDTDRPEPERDRITEDEVEAELARFRKATEAVAASLAETGAGLRSSGHEEEAGIFDFHVEMAEDPELASSVEERVRKLHSPEAAVLAAGEEYAAQFAEMDEYMAARADDVRDVTGQISAELMGRSNSSFAAMQTPSVVLARTLAPSDTARIKAGLALGFVTAEGSRTSHVSIMARSMGIPAVVGVGEALEGALDAKRVAIDGNEGTAITDPDEETVARFQRMSAALAEERAALDEYRHVEARTSEGRRIEVAANLGSASEAEDALGWGAEGVGLFRTEFLFMEREELPSEDEQYDAYSAVARAFGEKPVIIRTLDVGGDKDLPGVDQAHEENPFLGWRGIRMSLDTPDLFQPQLRAILRAAADGNIKVMFPMVADVGELKDARMMLQETRAELEAEGVRDWCNDRNPGCGAMRRGACQGVGLLLHRDERSRTVHPGRRQGRRATPSAPERRPSCGSGPDPADLRGRKRGRYPRGRLRRSRRRTRHDPQTPDPRRHRTKHEPPLHTQSQKGRIRAVRAHVFPDYEAMSTAAADTVAQSLEEDPSTVLMLPTGITPLGM